MSDTVTCKAVLKKALDSRNADTLFVAVPPDYGARILPCRPKGTPQRGERPEWEYEEIDGRLRLTPSLLATDTGFHTDSDWECDYELPPENVSQFDHFYAINPDIKQP